MTKPFRKKTVRWVESKLQQLYFDVTRIIICFDYSVDLVGGYKSPLWFVEKFDLCVSVPVVLDQLNNISLFDIYLSLSSCIMIARYLSVIKAISHVVRMVY